jgi:hypothetical protein
MVLTMISSDSDQDPIGPTDVLPHGKARVKSAISPEPKIRFEPPSTSD